MLKKFISAYTRVFFLRIKNQSKVYKLLAHGAKINNPKSIEIRGEINTGEEVEIGNNVIFEGRVTLSNRVKIEDNCFLKDCKILTNTKIRYNSMIEGCQIGSYSSVGPFGRIRPSSIIGDNGQIGNFVEIKNSTIGIGVRINHLTYIGDTVIGNDVTIGAGSVTCNFNGKKTNKTTIEDNAFIGSGVYLVAPVTIREGATIGSGSVITEDAPPHKLTLGRSKQITIHNWDGPKDVEDE